MSMQYIYVINKTISEANKGPIFHHSDDIHKISLTNAQN